jgi:hypothetical protein
MGQSIPGVSLMPTSLKDSGVLLHRAVEAILPVLPGCAEVLLKNSRVSPIGVSWNRPFEIRLPAKSPPLVAHVTKFGDQTSGKQQKPLALG